MNRDEAYEYALSQAPRNEDGSVDEKVLRDLLAASIDYDEREARLRLASQIIDSKKRPGRTAPEGQLALPGLEPFAYEPNRLVGDDRHHLIENAKARPSYKAAEARRAQENAMRVQVHATRKQRESSLYSDWALEQLGNGRRGVEITYDNFVRESGVWNPAEAPPEDEGE
jgi:hypothetical protein